MKRKHLIFLLVALLALALASGGWFKASGKYWDVRDATSRANIAYYRDAGVLTGSFTGRFRPNAVLRAGELDRWLLSLLEKRTGEARRALPDMGPRPLNTEDVVGFMSSYLFRDPAFQNIEPTARSGAQLQWAHAVLTRAGHTKKTGDTLTRAEGLQLLRALDARAFNHYDVVVYGSELESVSAAVVAARSGANVLLIHEKPQVGGLLVDGKLNYVDMPQSDGQWLIQGFAKLFYDEVGNSFDFERARNWMEKALDQELVVRRHCTPEQLQLQMNGTNIESASDGVATWHGRMFIDASENGDLMAQSGAEFSLGLEDVGRPVFPGTTLIYELKNVNYEQVSDFLRQRQAQEGTFEGATPVAAWGFGQEMAAYTPGHEDILVRAMNIAYVKETGHVVCNHVVNVNINPLDAASVAQARQSLETEIEELIPYLRAQVPGFAQAELAGFAKDLYLRDSRHLIGSHQLSVNEIINRAPFEDTVLISNYPIDVHASLDNRKNLIIYYPQSYNIPYRCLHDDYHGNLLVSGKCASYRSLAAGSTRIVMTGTMMSEVAARAAVQAIAQGTDVQHINVGQLQTELAAAGFIREHPAPLKRTVPENLLKKLDTGFVQYQDLVPADTKK